MRQDAAILWRLLRGQPRHGSLAQRLEGFYRPQAERYDAFRERLLHGRRELVESLDPAPGARLVELGGGTGRNLEFFGPRLAGFAEVTLVDLCPALLEQARRRARDWPNVRVVAADACTWRPREPVDCVYFSYALTMIPDWRRAVDNALALLRPGGRLGVVDFYVSPPRPEPGRVRHGALTRRFWPLWFGHDGVHPHPGHLPYLLSRVQPLRVEERRGTVPYLPGLRAPYYLLVGCKRP